MHPRAAYVPTSFRLREGVWNPTRNFGVKGPATSIKHRWGGAGGGVRAAMWGTEGFNPWMERGRAAGRRPCTDLAQHENSNR